MAKLTPQKQLRRARLDNARLKEIRKDLGLSQAAFGERIGATKAAISAYELGQREPHAPIMLRYLLVAGIPVEPLVTYDRA